MAGKYLVSAGKNKIPSHVDCLPRTMYNYFLKTEPYNFMFLLPPIKSKKDHIKILSYLQNKKDKKYFYRAIKSMVIGRRNELDRSIIFNELRAFWAVIKVACDYVKFRIDCWRLK